jgi:hypothetical protein
MLNSPEFSPEDIFHVMDVIPLATEGGIYLIPYNDYQNVRNLHRNKSPVDVGRTLSQYFVQKRSMRFGRSRPWTQAIAGTMTLLASAKRDYSDDQGNQIAELIIKALK